MEGSLAMSALLFLGAAIIMVPLMKKLGLSSVIGYIAGGILIGPFVLKLTARSGDVENIMHTTEFGVVMLLFLVGLELEPKKFWAMRKRIVGLGLSQMLITVLALTVIFYFAQWPFTTALTVALCFAMSSTAIVLQTLQEKKMFGTDAGGTSFSTLLFQDISVIAILAFLPLLARRSLAEDNELQLQIQRLPEWLQPFTVVAGVGLLIVLGRYVFVPFLRYVSRSDMSELLTASSLFLVIGVSELMNAVGLSPALGAFLAGVMLANSEFRHELEAQIDPFKGLLLAVFFVSVGASINFNIIKSDPVFILSTVLVVLVVKFLVLYGIGKFFKIEKFQTLFYAFALSQVGEFAFVLLNYSSKLYLLDATTGDQMMAVTAITMCVTPFLLILHDRLADRENANDDLKGSDYDIESGTQATKKIIIVGFGHFGSTVGRLLKASKVPATILDYDADRVKLLRSYGFKVFYGDATRLPVLRAAGIDNAEILVLCLADDGDNNTVAQIVRKYHPDVKIFVRVKNRLEAYGFLNHGIDNVYRETLGTAVEMAVDVLHESGVRKYAARRLGQRFMAIDKASVRKLAREKIERTGYTFREALLREEQLLATDSLDFVSDKWSDEDDTESNP